MAYADGGVGLGQAQKAHPWQEDRIRDKSTDIQMRWDRAMWGPMPILISSVFNFSMKQRRRVRSVIVSS